MTLTISVNRPLLGAACNPPGCKWELLVSIEYELFLNQERNLPLLQSSIVMIGNFYGVFTLVDIDTDKKWVVENCVEVFIPTPTQMQLGFKPVKVKSVSVSGSVNTPLHDKNDPDNYEMTSLR